jgi:hypothetical protein
MPAPSPFPLDEKTAMYPVKFSETDPTWLTCPQCGGDYLHHAAVTVFSRNKEDGPVTATVIDERNGVRREEGPTVTRACPSSRRDGLAIAFWCELCPALSELTVAQHKGITVLEWRITGRQLEDDFISDPQNPNENVIRLRKP